MTQPQTTTKRPPATTTLSVKLSAEVGSALAATARRRGVSRSFLVREALAAYLARDPAPEARRFATLAADLIGRFPGPEDLATHPDHLDGFGT